MLVRVETSPEDLRGMIAAEGILTARGGVSSHAALVARQMGKVCVCGASALQIDYGAKTVTAGDVVLNKGDFISIDGTSGEVFARGGQDRAFGSGAGAGGKDPGRQAERHLPAVRRADEDGRRLPPAANPHQRRHARPGGQRPGLRRAGRGAGPHGTHVLRGRPHRRDARDDPGHRHGGAQGRPGQAAALSTGGLRGHLPRAEGFPGHDPLPRPARCTSSCRTTRRRSRTWPKSWA